MSNISQFFNSGGDPQYWVSGTTYALGKTVRSPTDHQRYVRVVAGAGTTDPANDATNWRPDGARPIKSIQRGVIVMPVSTSSVTATISAVNTAKSELRFLGSLGTNGASPPAYVTSKIQLTNSTTLTADSSGFVYGHSLSWELTEYY